MTMKSPVIGILALQGDYQKHGQVLKKIGLGYVYVRRSDDFERIDRLIIPGGESTTMLDLLRRFDLELKFESFIKEKPVWGTCAGMVLLAQKVNNTNQKSYGRISIDVDRNGYGRQYFSTVEPSEISLNGKKEHLNLVYIRAPKVTSVGEGVKILLRRGKDPVLLSQNNILVSSFHPELTGSTILHEYFAFRF